MKNRKPTTLIEVCVAAAGGRYRDVIKGTKVATFVLEWAWASHDRYGGEWISTADFAEYWEVTDRHAWRRRSLFHEVFPDRDPNELAAVAVASFRRSGVKALADVGVTVDVDLTRLGWAA